MSLQSTNPDTYSLKVSVIMNCYNCEKYLQEAIDSVYAQTYRDWEIIFWDNQSTDNSAVIARRYDGKLKYFLGQYFLPLGAARNEAIKKASGEYIAFLDCDDLWLPEKLEKQLNYLESNKDIGLIYSDCYYNVNGKIIENTSFNNVKPFKGNVFDELLCNYFAPFLTVVIRKTALDKVGVFDSQYNIVEDYDLLLRIAEYYSFDFLKQPLAVYRIHDGNTSKNIKMTVGEYLKLMKYWLFRKPTLKKRLISRIKQHEAELRFSLIYYYFSNSSEHKTKKCIKEIFNFLILFPYNIKPFIKNLNRLFNLI